MVGTYCAGHLPLFTANPATHRSAGGAKRGRPLDWASAPPETSTALPLPTMSPPIQSYYSRLQSIGVIATILPWLAAPLGLVNLLFKYYLVPKYLGDCTSNQKPRICLWVYLLLVLYPVQAEEWEDAVEGLSDFLNHWRRLDVGAAKAEPVCGVGGSSILHHPLRNINAQSRRVPETSRVRTSPPSLNVHAQRMPETSRSEHPHPLRNNHALSGRVNETSRLEHINNWKLKRTENSATCTFLEALSRSSGEYLYTK